LTVAARRRDGGRAFSPPAAARAVAQRIPTVRGMMKAYLPYPIPQS
jgi:hypothetical protein